jgi:hypothetical protein
MENKNMSKSRRVNLGISVDEQHRGLKNLDFFADHASQIRDMRYMANNISADMGTLYLRTALTNMTCPICSEKVKRNIKNPLLEWFLKFLGRRILYCTGCDWKQIVKESGWQWETFVVIIVASIVVFFASIHWILR